MKKKENTSNDTIKHVRFISLTKKFDDQSIYTSQLRLKCTQSSSKCFCSYIKIKQYYLFECRYGIMCIKRNCEFHHPNGRFAAGDSNRPWTNRGQRRPTYAEIVRIHAPSNHVSWRGFLGVCPILTSTFQFEVFLKFSLTKRFKIEM